MHAIVLSDQFIKTLSLPESDRIDIPDKDARGLYLRVSSSGVKSWSFVYNSKGKRYRMVLGQYPGVSLKLARERAREARGAVQRGENPVEDKKVETRELKAVKANGFRTCLTDYIDQCRRRPVSVEI